MREETVGGELFLYDAYLREFDSRVLRVQGREVLLEHTAFCPGGAGQPHDKGLLKVGPIEARVVDVRRREYGIIHVTDKPVPHTVEHLVGELDWGRRYTHMRHRTALRVLSALLRRDFGARVTGGKIYADRARADFSLPGEWSPETAGEVQAAANGELAAGRQVRVYYVSSQEAEEMQEAPSHSRDGLEVEESGPVRVAEVEGLDTRADGGTHVANTTEVGEIEITAHESKGRNKRRVEFVLL